MILKFFRRNIDTEPTPDAAEATADTRAADVAEAHSAPCFKKLGPMWEERPKAPLAIVDGFHQEWLRSSITRHLPKHRVLHVRPDHDWHDIRSQLDRMDRFTLYSWQGSGRDELAAYARQRGARAVLVDYGPLPTVARSAQDRLAMSLRFDILPGEPDASRHHRLLQILKRHDFDSDPDLLEKARQLLELYRGLGLSCTDRPGQPGVARHALGIKIKPRLLVIGQEDDYLATQNTSNRNIISRALRKNPDHEILYWPHPAERKEATAAIEQTAALRGRFEVIRFNPVVAELFEQIDKVYVFDSDTGLDAVFYGLPVHALGRPYYAGWGLTDGRPVARNRTLGTTEMFCAVLVLYPSYLPEPDNPFHSLLATMLRHTAETAIRQPLPTEPQRVVQYVEQSGVQRYWPAILRREVLRDILTGRKAKSLPTLLPVRDILKATNSRHYQRFAAAFILGQLRGTKFENNILKDIIQNLHVEDARQLLQALWKKGGRMAIARAAIFFHNLHNETEEAERIVDLLLEDGGKSITDSPSRDQLEAQDLALIADDKHRRRKLDDAERLCLSALLSGASDLQTLLRLSEISHIRQDFEGSHCILDLINLFDPNYKAARVLNLLSTTATIIGSSFEALKLLSRSSTISGNVGANANNVLNQIAHNLTLSSLDLHRSLRASVEVIDRSQNPVSLAAYYIREKRSERAIQILSNFTPKHNQILNYIVNFSQALRYSGNPLQSKILIERYIKELRDEKLFVEAIRVGVALNDYEWLREVLELANESDVILPEGQQRVVLWGLGQINEAFKTFREISTIPILKEYFMGKFIQSLEQLDGSKSECLMVLATSGPGDEIRFASLYERYRERSFPSRVQFTCDPRLYELLQRSYPTFHFVSSQRNRDQIKWIKSDNTDKVPGVDLHGYIDNDGWAALQACTKIALVTDLLCDVIEGHSSFDGKPYLLACPDRVDEFRQRLEKLRDGTTLLGLSWRSSLTTYSRDEHYLSVEQLAPLFEIEGVQFVNLQYDDCADELAWVEERYPGKIINFEDLNQFDDLDGVAALMTATDAVIAPCTTVIELAGALGCRGYLLSNSSELHWRKKPGTKTDVWHNSLTHVESTSLGDKELLVEALVERIRSDFSDRKAAN